MHLKSLDLSDFRAFRHARLELPETGLVLIAGVTNSGKSALLSAFDVVLGLGVPADPRHVAADGPSSVVARFQLDVGERTELLKGRSDAPDRLDDGTLSWVQLEWQEHAGQWLVVAVRGAWQGDEQLLAAVAVEDASWQVRAITALDPNVGEATGLVLQMVTSVNGPTSVFTGVLAARGFGPLLDAYSRFQRSAFRFAPYRRPPPRVGPLHSAAVMDSDGGNLPQVLVHLKTNEERRFEKLRALIERLVPSLGVLEVRTLGQEVRVVFDDRFALGHEENLVDLGAGIGQLIPLLVAGLTQPSRLLLVEEPETNLNPGAQRALLWQLEEWSRDRLIIATTHSSSMLDRAVASGASVWVVRRTGNESTLHEAAGDRAAAYTELGVRYSDVLSAERLLIVEGPSDEAVLRAWFPELLGRADVAVHAAGGGDDALHANRLAEYLEALDRLEGRALLYLRDRDELPDRLTQRLEQSPSVHLLGRRELENYLLDDLAALGEVLADVGMQIQPQELAAVLREEAEGLRERVVAGRVSWELEPVYPVPHSLRRKVTRAGGGVQALIDAVLPRYPERADVERLIHEHWAAAEAELVARWASDWPDLVPGADLLDGVWRRATGRGYDKRTDGATLARRITPPQQLRAALDAFLGRDLPLRGDLTS